MTPSDVMTTAEVAQYLRVNKATVYRLIHEENLPAVKIGNLWRVRRDLLEEWLKERGTWSEQSNGYD
jgi:excisionase family DNA binding protein